MSPANRARTPLDKCQDEVARLRPYAEAYGGERLLPLSVRILAAHIDYLCVNGVKREGVSRNPAFESRPPGNALGDKAQKLRDNYHAALVRVAADYEARFDRLVGEDWSPPLTDAEVERWHRGAA